MGDNSSRISTVSTDLGDNSSRISTVSSDLADNSSRITTVSSDLADNSSRIDSLGDGAHTFTGVKTFQDDIILESNLRVNGSLTYANTVNMIVSDPIMELGANNQHTNDLGLVLTRHGNSGNDSNVAIFYDETADNLKIGYTDDGASQTTLSTTATGLDVSITGNVAAAYNTDETSYFGRAAVGYMGQSDQASFSHIDKNTSTDFALKQAASGATHLNTPTGQHIRFSVNASEVGRFTGGGDFKVGANKLYVDSSASEVQMYSQATGSTAGPDLVLMRDNGSSAGSNGDYIGQVRYEGRSDTGTSRLYAKTTGKIKTATNGSESGIIETALRTSGSQRISVRHSGDLFHIKNGTDFQVGEVANLYVDTSTSRVGIGKSNPSYTLDVDGDINLSSGSTLKINGTPAVFSNWTVSGSDIYRSSGNVGIGTTSPGDMLHIYKNGYTPRVLIETPGAHDAELRLKNSNGQWTFRCLDSSGDLRFNGTSGFKLALTQGGSVGIGTATIDAPLHVFKQQTTGLNGTTDGGGIKMERYANNGCAIWSQLVGNTTDTMSFRVVNNATDAYGGVPQMVLTHQGRLGIGTASPGYKLDVLTDTDWDGIMLRSASNSYGYLLKDGNGCGFGMNESGSRKVYIRTNADSYFTGGNVGIGTTGPACRLHVDNGDIGFEYGHGLKVATSNGSMSAWTSGTHNLIFTNWSNNTGAGDVVKFYTPGSQSSTVRMILTSAGNVGINTETMIDSRNYGGLHLVNSKGISFAASTNSDSRHWRVRTDDYSDHGSLQFGVSDNNSTCPDAQDEVVMTMDRNRRIGLGAGAVYPRTTLQIGDYIPNNSGTNNTIPTSNMGHAAVFPASTKIWMANRYISTEEDYWGCAMGVIWDGATYFQSINKKTSSVYNILLQPNGGYVGIGTDSPKAMLHVNGTGSPNIGAGTRSYFAYNSNFNAQSWGTWSGSWGTVSILASGTIVTQNSIVATNGTIGASDQRIKQNIENADDAECLETLRLLKPKKYQYRDVVERGEEPVWGFIAQEVRDTLPHATQLRQEFIPNIYELGNVSSSNLIAFTNFNTSNLESNNATTLIRTKGIDGKDHDIHLVEVIDEHTIRVEEDLTDWTGSVDGEGNVISEITTTTITPEEYEALEDTSGYVANISGYQNANVSISVEEYNAREDTTGYEQVVQDYTKTSTTYPGNQLFVYGQQVDDFVFLKKESIFTVATAALQEVDRQQQADKLRIAELEERIDALVARMEAVESL